MEHYDAGVPTDGLPEEYEEELERIGLGKPQFEHYPPYKGPRAKVLPVGVPRNATGPGDNVVLPNHYARFEIEPIHFIGQNQLNFFQGNVIKYILRHDAKNGIEDIKKAIRYARMYQLKLEGYEDWAGIDPRVKSMTEMFKALHRVVESIRDRDDRSTVKMALVKLEADYATTL